MKNKKFIYGLILSVVAVWGIIVHKIFTAATPGEVQAEVRPVSNTRVVLADYEVKDTFTLVLNYRDPFSETGREEKIKPDAAASNKPLPTSLPVMNHDYVKYGGYIVNPGTKKVVSILTINGKEQMMNDGNVFGDVRLIRNYKDSIGIIYKDKTYFIRKTN